jgi:protein O-GlcNAc transferase
MTDLDTAALIATQRAHAAGDAQGALKGYQAILARQPAHAGALHGLGVLALQHGQPEQGERLLRAAATGPASTPAMLADWATALQTLGRAAEALAPLRRCVALAPDFGPGWYNLGNALVSTGDDDAALAAYDRALAQLPVQAGFNRANVLARLGRHAEAVDALRAVIAADAQHADALNNLGVSLLALGQDSAALAALTQAVELAPNAADAALNHAEALARSGQTEPARAAFARAAQLAPTRLRSRWAARLSLPPLCDSDDEINAWRQRFADGLSALEAECADSARAAPEDLEAILTSTAFHLNYHGRDDRALQTRYAALVQQIARRVLAHHHRPDLPHSRRATSGRRIRVGFVSDFLFGHSVTKTHGAWMTDLDPARFEVFCIHTGTVRDAVTADLARRVSGFAHHPHFGEGLLRAIADMRADVLIYPDLGMSPTTQVLAALRLAPVQVNGLGHPVTSGFDSIDWAVSAALAEPEGAQAFYTERLALLPHLAMRYERARIEAQKPITAVPSATGGAPVLFCAQSLYKLLPRDDGLFARLAAQLPDAKLWFIAHPAEAVTRRFEQRLARAFAAEGLNWQLHCVIHPRQSQEAFLALNQQATVFLDAPGWSGNNSALEALACGLLPVTLPGPMFRMRHSLAILQRIGLDDALVARDADDYVARVVQVASDPARAHRLRARLAETAHTAFDDPAPAVALGALIAGWADGGS